MAMISGKAGYAIAAILLVNCSVLKAGEVAHPFTIPRGPLGAALAVFETQSGVRTIAAVDVLAGKLSNEVGGQMTAQDALREMLAGSGLAADLVGDTYVIHPESISRTNEKPPTSDEITVTGTRIRGSAPIGSPVHVIDRTAIEDSGRATLPDLLQTVPQNFGGGQTEGTAGGNTARNDASVNTGFGSSINLRGLGSTSTLTLLDGSRPALSGFDATFADVSLIPTVAIDRIEILTDGASSIYGSDAVAGVVNLRFRNRFEGFEAHVYDGTADGSFGQEQVSAIAGKRWSNGGVVVAWQYDHRDALPASDRPYGTQDLTRYGGPDNRTGYALPATIIAADGSTYSATRIGTANDPLTSADLVPGAINLHDDVRDTDLLPRQDSQSIYLAADQALFGGASWFARILWARRHFEEHAISSDDAITVTPTNPYYVDPLGTGEPITIERDFTGELGVPLTTGHVTGLNATSGVRGDLAAWHYELSGAFGLQRELNDETNLPNQVAIATAGASSDPAAALNPFGPDTAQVANMIRGQYRFDTVYKVWTGAARFDGPLIKLPAGPLRLAFGAEYHHDRFHGFDLDDLYYATPTVNRLDAPPQVRHVTAEYAELAIPVLSGHQFPGRLDLSLSGRLEHYSDFGATRNPKVGARWEPVTGLSLRGTWGTSFRAPNLYEKGAGSEDAVYGVLLPDPTSPTGQTAVVDLGGYSPNIGPERATTWTAGFDFKPVQLPGFTFSATYFHTDYRNRIGCGCYEIYDYLEQRSVYGSLIQDNPSPAEVAALFANPLFTNLSGITPDEVKAITDGREENLSEDQIRGIDFDLGYTRRLGGGTLYASLSGTRFLSYKTKFTASSTPTEIISTYGEPARLRMRGSLGWHDTHYDLSAAVNYTGPYRNTLFIPAQPVNAWTTLDIEIGRTIAHVGQHGQVHLALSATNLLNTAPPYIANVQVNSTVGYDAQEANAIGRLIALQGKVSW